MNDEDLLARVQHRGRLHGRNEARRAVCAVVEALGEFLSPRAFHLLTDQLPDPVRHLVRDSASSVMARPDARTFLAGIAARLLMEGPDAAFTTRIILEELNATGRVITPARFAHLVEADLRPLLCARRAPITADETNPAPRRIIRVSPAHIRPPAAPATGPAAPAATSATRPAIAPAATAANRPATAPATSATRPAVAPAATSAARPAVAPAATSATRPAVAPAATSATRPAVAPVATSATRPATAPAPA
ncbi:DUF2267 domain-containing protein [Actinoplanes sp. NPDC051343]|uniref:DUF2267 domain-containing protein n=1 Tax=Actinoplanes sp. NPDC051343 TaxID=3363906 RepID=UPI00379F0538